MKTTGIVTTPGSRSGYIVVPKREKGRSMNGKQAKRLGRPGNGRGPRLVGPREGDPVATVCRVGSQRRGAQGVARSAKRGNAGACMGEGGGRRRELLSIVFRLRCGGEG